MSAPEIPPVRSVLILKADRLMAETIQYRAMKTWPEAEYRLENREGAARAALKAASVDMLITGLGMLDGDVCDLVRFCVRLPRAARRIVVVTGRRDPRMLAMLRELPIDGVFDSATETLPNLSAALREIQLGKKYVSRSFIDLLCDREMSGRNIFQQLTAAEILILAVMGDGCHYHAAAERLDLEVETIRSTCRNLYRKLGIQHRGDLIRIAHECGLVRITQSGVERLGFSLLVERYESSRARGKVRTPFIDELCAGAR